MSIKIITAVWKSNIGDPVSKLVLLKLADNADDSGLCWPSIAMISDATELSERTVYRKMRGLENLGLIEVNRGVNRCDYKIKIDSLVSNQIPPTPDSLSPCHAVTLTESQPTPDSLSPLPCHSVTPTLTECQLHKGTVIESSQNHQRIVTSPDLSSKDDERVFSLFANNDETNSRGDRFAQDKEKTKIKKKADEPEGYPEIIGQLWKLFPPPSRNRSSQKKLADAWRVTKNKPDPEMVLAMLGRWAVSDAWQNEGGKFVPAAEKWIKDRKWEAEPCCSKPSQTKPKNFESDNLGI